VKAWTEDTIANSVVGWRMAKGKTAVEAARHRVIATNVEASGLSRAGRDGIVTAGGFDEQVNVFDAKTGKRLATYGAAGGVCWYAERSSKGAIAAGFGDLNVRIWEPEAKKPQVLGPLGGIVASLAWSADGTYLFTGNCGDRTVRLWDAAKGVVIAEGKTKKSGTWFVAMTGDAKHAVSGAGDKLIHVWDPKKGIEVATLAGHTGRINALAFFPDGKRVISASQDRTARIWNLITKKELFVFRGHRKEIKAIAIAPNGDQVATSSSDGTIRLWNPKKGVEDGILSMGAAYGESIAYSADGAELFVGGSDSVVRAFALQGDSRASADPVSRSSR
jgi:WD40 repeat protein